MYVNQVQISFQAPQELIHEKPVYPDMKWKSHEKRKFEYSYTSIIGLLRPQTSARHYDHIMTTLYKFLREIAHVIRYPFLRRKAGRH